MQTSLELGLGLVAQRLAHLSPGFHLSEV
jgi:hypothetical protein